MRLSFTVLLLGLVVGACGGADTTKLVTTSSVPPAAATVAPITSATSTTSSSGDSAGQIPELDRSILSLALAPGDTGPGRFLLEPGPNTEILMKVEGRYWVTEQGNVYTALNVDPELIAGQMALLAASIEAVGGQAGESSYLVSLREHYRGDEFQIGLTDLVRSFAAGGLPAEWAEQWSWFVQADGSPVPTELVACREAIAQVDLAARRWVDDLEIRFVEGAWTFPIEDFERALAAETEVASVCELFIGGAGSGPEIVIALSGEPDKRRIEVLVDDKVYVDREPELMFAIVMSPDESVGPLPSDPNPASLLTLRGSYLTAISVCGELPWIYSNFAAANSWERPGSGDYLGPTIFASGWYCEDRVPEERRNAGG